MDWVISNYGFLLPYRREVDAEYFANRIKEAYAMDCKQNEIAYKIVKDSNCIFLYSWFGKEYRYLGQ